MPIARFDAEGFAKRVLSEMKHHGLSFSEMATKAGVPHTSLSRLLYEYKGCKIDIMASVAKVLELDLMDFICKTSPRRRDYIRV